jgi:hypothetical protein
MIDLAVYTADGWRPGIGDPSLAGWLTVAAYLAAGAAGWSAGRASPRQTDLRRPDRCRICWYILALLMISLGINKQLDLQSAATQTGRWIVREMHWMTSKRTLQTAFVYTVVGSTAMACLALAIWNRADLGRMGLAMVGLAAVISFVAIRAASFHRVDHLLGVRLAGLAINWILELSGVILILINALWRLRRAPALPAFAQSENHD